MAGYNAPLLQGTTSTGYKTAGQVWISVILRRIALYEIEIGAIGALNSQDCQIQWDVSRFSATAIMTASPVTPNVNDNSSGGSAVASASFSNNNTGELTYTTAGAGLSLKNWGINQRGSYRWRALDNGSMTDSLVIAATAQMGNGFRLLSSGYTGTAVGTISFMEM